MTRAAMRTTFRTQMDAPHTKPLRSGGPAWNRPRRTPWGKLKVVAALLAVASLPVRGAPPGLSPISEIDWRTSPLDLNLRGQNGKRYRFQCPPGKVTSGQVIGSGPYTDSSGICAAGVHAGVIRAGTGGVLTIEVRPGQAHYPGSVNHDVQSESYEKFWSGSFVVVGSDAAASPAT
jgi:LCCL domain-containing protein